MYVQLTAERQRNGELAQRHAALQQKLTNVHVKIVAQTAKYHLRSISNATGLTENSLHFEMMACCAPDRSRYKLSERRLRAAERNLQAQLALVERLSAQLAAAQQMDAQKLLQGCVTHGRPGFVLCCARPTACVQT